MTYIRIEIHTGMVAQENRWDKKASLAPVVKSSPISLGNTMVLRPQGIQAMKTAGSISSVSPRDLQRTKTIMGMTARRRKTTRYVVLSATISRIEKMDRCNVAIGYSGVHILKIGLSNLIIGVLILTFN